jgi:C4-dicarboxylate-specific signal transduction histidine kinase
MNLDRERDAIIQLCLKAAGVQEEALKAFPQNVHYKEYAQMARWVADEVEKRKGVVFDEDGSEIEGEALAGLNEELLACREENVELKGLLVGMRVERERLLKLSLAHEENAHRISEAHGKSIDAHQEKDALIRQLTEKHGKLKETMETLHNAVDAERKLIRDHERGLCVSALEKMATEMMDTHHVYAVRQAIEKLNA